MWRTPSRRRSGSHLAAEEALTGEGRRAGVARGLLGDHSNELCRGEVRCGESSSATPCAFPRLPHWEVFAVPLGVVDNRRSKGCWVFDHLSYDALLQHCFTICGKNDWTMYRLGLLFEMEKAFWLMEEEKVIERGNEEAEAGAECRICRIVVRRRVMYIELVVTTN